MPFASLYLCLAIIGAVQARLLAGPMPVVSDYGETQAPKCERIFICGACGDAKRLHKKRSKEQPRYFGCSICFSKTYGR